MQPTTQRIASEENSALEVINTIGTTDSHLHYQGTTNNLKGEMLIFILIEITVIPFTILIVSIIHLDLLEIPNTSNNKVNAITTQSSNNSDLIGSLQSQILGLQTQALWQSTLNSIKIFDSTNKSEFTSWVQSVENATRLCNLDTRSIALSKLQGPPLKSASYLESKEISSGKQLVWPSLNKHLTSNYSEILYDTHAESAYDSLHQGNDESKIVYLHRAQDIFKQVICPLIPL